jgi:hypothetical protein
MWNKISLEELQVDENTLKSPQFSFNKRNK